MDYDLLYPGRFMKSGEFEGQDRIFTVVAVRVEELEQDKGGVRGKGIVSFSGEKKEWVLNRTNGECLKAMWGRETNAWLGKRVTLFPAPFFDPFTKTQGTAIRVRGSPDLSAPLSVVIRLRKKRETTMTLTRTGGPIEALPAPAPISASVAGAVAATAQSGAGIRRAMKALLEQHELRGAPAVALVQRVTRKITGYDAADLALLDAALGAEHLSKSATPRAEHLSESAALNASNAPDVGDGS